MPWRYKYAFGSACAAILAVPAIAQESDGAATSQGGLQQIVVTAQKRSENLQNVPISVAALSAQAIEQTRAVTLRGLQGAVPNIQINNFTNTPNTAVITIRGIGVVDPDPFAGNTVSIVQDGIPQYFSMGALLDLYDVERVEVLRGPQGTLFGANSTGGVVNVVTRQPTGKFEGRGELTYGNYNHIEAKGALDFPIVDGLLAGKIAIAHTSRDGYYTNIVNGHDLGGQDRDLFRAYLKLTPSADFDATLIGEYGRVRSGSPVIVNGAFPGDAVYIAPGTLVPGAKLPVYVNPCTPNQMCKAPDKYYSASDFVPDESNMDTYSVNLTANWRNSGIGNITSITGYKYFKLSEYTDNDALPGLYIDTFRKTKGWQFSQELRSSIKVNDKINLLVGGFYLKDHYDHFMSLRLQFAQPGLRQYNPQDQNNWSGSLFAQTFVDLTDKLRFQAGIRYTHERTRMTAGVENYLSPSGVGLLCTHPLNCGDEVDLGGFLESGARSWNKLGWKFDLDYKLTSSTLIYAYYARGFKSGGFVGRVSQPSDLGPYNPETVDTYEAGIKSDLFDRHLRANLSVFYTNYRNMQVEENYITPNGTGIGTSIFNAAKSTIKGAELELTAIPTEGLTLTGALAYLDAKYKNFQLFDPVAGSIDMHGKPLQNSPKWTASAGLNYSRTLGPGKISFNAQYVYTSSKYFQGLADPIYVRIQPTNYVNGSIGWTPDGGAWSIELWGRNLANKHYIDSATYNPGLFNQISYTPPREFGGTIKVKFK